MQDGNYDFSVELEKVMQSRNFNIRGSINYRISGKFQRFANADKPKRSKDLFVILHDYDRGASFGNWHYPDDNFTYWNPKYENEDLAQKRIRKILALEQKIQAKYEESKRKWRAREFWHKFYLSYIAVFHPYVLRKRILPYHAKVIRSWLLVPVHDIDHNFVTLQIIKPDGFKRLWKGTSQKNNMMWLCDLPLDKRYEGIIRVCEGYATGCTIREITKSPVVCAINANNLLNTVVQLRQNFIHADIRICADNDAYGEINSGLLHGKNAAKRTGSTLYFPTFEGCCIDKKPTDFNDLFILAGKDLVKEILSIPRSL